MISIVQRIHQNRVEGLDGILVTLQCRDLEMLQYGLLPCKGLVVLSIPRIPASLAVALAPSVIF